MNENISRWDVSDVVTMDQMFDGATSFDQDLSPWDVRRVFSIQTILSSTVRSADQENPTLRKTIAMWLFSRNAIHVTK